MGRVSVPDDRLTTIAKIAGSAQTIPTQIEFVDIAGLVKGASKGEGLGNQFLSHIRQVDAIVHVLRCFEDKNITHVEGSVDPLRDAEIIETELIISDMESLEKRIPALEKKLKSTQDASKEDLKGHLRLMTLALEALQNGDPVRSVDLKENEPLLMKELNLITSRPVLYVCNVSEQEASEGNAHTQKALEKTKREGAAMVIISAAIESEVSLLRSQEEQQEFLEDLGLKETGLNRVIQQGYKLLDLITFFTVGPKEARAWTLKKEGFAPQAAGVIHSDFERGFICAETISYDDFIHYNGEQGAKNAGKMNRQGKTYSVQDGDIFHFRFNV